MSDIANKENIKQKRSLSGIYFRFKNPETGNIENRTFEDLPELEQDRVMKDRPVEWLQGLVKRLSKVLNEVADITGATKEEDDD